MSTPRHMYDATHDNVRVLLPFNPSMVAIYLTGTVDVRWTTADVQLFPNVKTFVRIDQRGPGSPQYSATVADVEDFAWNVHDAETLFLPNCTAARPTIYCNRNTLPNVTAKCDIWLSAPGLTDAEAIALAATDDRIVAVQNLFAGPYDKSVVIDPYWPERKPVTTPNPTPPPVGIQDGWNFCTKCGCLVHVPEANTLPCAGGGNHNPHSHDYFLPYV